MQTQLLNLERDDLTLSANLHTSQQANHAAPLVVLVHGFPDTPHSWDKILPILLTAGYRVLTPWLRGYTHGSAKRDARYDLLSVAADIEAWRCELNAGQAHLVGHDWGAAVANVLAGQDNAGAWQTISLLAVPPLPHAGQWAKLLPQLPKQLLYSAYMPVMQLSVSHHLLTRNDCAYVRRLWRRWSPGWDFDDAEFAPTKKVFSNPQMAWAATRYYRNLFRWHDPQVRQALALMQQPFTVPTMLLVGCDDGCMHPRTHELIVDGARGSLKLQQLPDCGHFLQAEQPQAVGDALLAHFSRPLF